MQSISYKTLFCSVVLGILLLFPGPALAQRCPPATDVCSDKMIKLQYAIPGVTCQCTTKSSFPTYNAASKTITESPRTVHYVENLTTYMKNVYDLFIGLVALGAVIMIMIGGFQWLLAAGNQQRIGQAKSMITSAIGGLALSLLSFIILQTINPRLTTLTLTNVDPVSKIDSSIFCINYPNALKSSSDPTPAGGATLFAPTSDGSAARSDNTTQAYGTACGFPYYARTPNPSAPQGYNPPDTRTSCLGLGCDGNPKGNACYQGECIDGIIFGSITIDTLALNKPFIDDNLYLAYTCVGSPNWYQFTKVKDMGPLSVQQATGYVFANEDIDGSTSFSAATRRCGNDESKVRFFLIADVNDQGLGITGTDDWYALDRTCAVPVVENGRTDPCGLSTSQPGQWRHCMGGSDAIDWALVDPNTLITLPEIRRGFKCDINLNRSNFTGR